MEIWIFQIQRVFYIIWNCKQLQREPYYWLSSLFQNMYHPAAMPKKTSIGRIDLLRISKAPRKPRNHQLADITFLWDVHVLS